MAPEERTRKASRRKLIVESKTDIDDDRFDEDRLTFWMAERQSEDWKPHRIRWISVYSDLDGAVIP